MIRTLTVPSWAQGRAGMGQGGWSASGFAYAIGEPVVVSFRSPIPIDTTMTVRETDAGWTLTADDGPGGSPRLVMEAEPRAADHFEAIGTPPVTVAEARDARSRFPEHAASDDQPTTH
ncbi:MAG: hypothetical protein O3C27_04555, partial [Actinomycetota bacterium]|nr:hypothetical protein [Actinomycetota bacterium]